MGSIREALGRNVLFHRERLGWTQAKLAEAIEKSASYVGHLERGEKEPSLQTIEELCLALRVPAGELFVVRERKGLEAQASAELQELLRDRSVEDLELVIRVTRAAFQHPALSGPLHFSGASSSSPKKRGRGRPPSRR